MAARASPSRDPNDAWIVPDDDPHSADDPAFLTESDSASSTQSLTSSIFNYQYENGRRYHAYREGEYMIPNDDREQDRLDLHHHVCRLTVGGALFRAPIDPSSARILDLGTGTGIWAIEMADDYPNATVTGTDLSPIQSQWVPPNCSFEGLDAAPGHKQSMIDAGFENVREEIYKVPLSPWAKDPKLKALGRYHQVNVLEGLESYSIALLTRVLGWKVEEVQALLVGVRQEVLDRHLHVYAKFYWVYGQKE